MEYKIITSDNKEKLEKKVEELLNLGWVLAGNIVVTFCKYASNERGIIQYTQALVK